MGVDFNHFDAIADALISSSQDVTQDIGKAAVQHIQEHIQSNGQVNTGTMLNSVTSDGQTVSVGVDYAVYQNYGTKFLPARPFFEPGLEDTNADMDDAMQKIVDAMAGVA